MAWSLDGSILGPTGPTGPAGSAQTAVRLTGDQVVTGTTQTVVNAFTTALAVGKYLVEVDGTWSAAATGNGLRLQLGATAGLVTAGIVAASQVATSATAVAFTSGLGIAAVSGSGTAAAAATPLPFRYFITLSVTTAGSLQVKLASSSTGAVSMLAGTAFRLTPLT